MFRGSSLRLFDFLMSLSDALELAFPRLARHQLRVAYLSLAISGKLGNSPERTSNIVIAALLHDIGALSPEEKVELRESGNVELAPHCIVGSRLLARSIPPLSAVAPLVRLHHSVWTDEQARNCGDAFLDAQIVGLADAVERAMDRNRYVLDQDREIVARVRGTSGTKFAPDVVEAFDAVASREELWLDLASPRLPDILADLVPCQGNRVEGADLYALSRLSRDIIDFRSPFTATHSAGVSATAAMFASLVGLSRYEADELAIAGNLHDIGKMAVPNRILLKESRLTDAEFAVIRQHTYHTYAIVRNMGFSRNIVESAAFHHERLDGSGYPFHVDRDRIGLGPRILAIADVFNALTEARPYRTGMAADTTRHVLRDMASSGALDGQLVGMLESRYESMIEYLEEERRKTRREYESDFMRSGQEEVRLACR